MAINTSTGSERTSSAASSRLSAGVQRAIAGAVILAILAALAGVAFSQRVTHPTNGESLNVVQGIAAKVDLPAGWSAYRTSGIDYVAMNKSLPLPAALASSIVAELTQADETAAAGAGSEAFQSVTDESQKTGKDIIAVARDRDLTGKAWWAVLNGRTGMGGDFSTKDRALAYADKVAKQVGPTAQVVVGQ